MSPPNPPIRAQAPQPEESSDHAPLVAPHVHAPQLTPGHQVPTMLPNLSQSCHCTEAQAWRWIMELERSGLVSFSSAVTQAIHQGFMPFSPYQAPIQGEVYQAAPTESDGLASGQYNRVHQSAETRVSVSEVHRGFQDPSTSLHAQAYQGNAGGTFQPGTHSVIVLALDPVSPLFQSTLTSDPQQSQPTLDGLFYDPFPGLSQNSYSSHSGSHFMVRTKPQLCFFRSCKGKEEDITAGLMAATNFDLTRRTEYLDSSLIRVVYGNWTRNHQKFHVYCARGRDSDTYLFRFTILPPPLSQRTGEESSGSFARCQRRSAPGFLTVDKEMKRPWGYNTTIRLVVSPFPPLMSSYFACKWLFNDAGVAYNMKVVGLLFQESALRMRSVMLGSQAATLRRNESMRTLDPTFATNKPT